MKKHFIMIAVLTTVTHMVIFAQSNYHIAKTFHIKSGGGYDYITVDQASDKLYVSHGNQVNVLNKKTGDSIGVIKSDKDMHGIALVHELGKGYITNGSANSVLVFDLKTNKVLAHVAAGEFSDGILYDDFSKKIISCNGKTKNMTVIDPATDKVVTAIQLTGWPETAVSDGKGRIYVNNAEKAEVDVIDATTFKVVNTWPNAPGKGAAGLAIDRSTMRLFAGCDNQMLIVMDATNGKIVAHLPIGDESDAIGFNIKQKTIYSSNGEGTLTIIKESSANKFTVTQVLKTQKGARTLAVDQFTHWLYLPTADFKPKDPKSFRPSSIPGTFRVLVVKE